MFASRTSPAGFPMASTAEEWEWKALAPAERAAVATQAMNVAPTCLMRAWLAVARRLGLVAGSMV
jgi:hypothetical protein